MPEHSSFIRRRSLALRLAVAIVGGVLSLASSAEPPLPALDIDITQTSISGISSGGFMTVQFQLAHSSIVKGAGVVAGGPFNCSKADVFRAVASCSCTGEPAVPCAVTESSADVPSLVAGAEDMARQGLIDATGNHKSMVRALEFAAFAGRVVYVGITQQLLEIPHAPYLHRRELTLLASRNARSTDFARIVKLIEDGRIDTRPWITHHADFAQVPEVFPTWLKPETGVIKAVVRME